MQFSWRFGTRANTAPVLSTLMAALVLGACNASGSTTADVADDALKGGIPANGHVKTNHRQQNGDEDAGVDEDDDRGPKGQAGKGAENAGDHGPKAGSPAEGSEHGNGKGKGAAGNGGDGQGKAKGPKAGAGGHGHGDEDEAADEGVSNAGAGGDADGDADEGADEGANEGD